MAKILESVCYILGINFKRKLNINVIQMVGTIAPSMGGAIGTSGKQINLASYDPYIKKAFEEKPDIVILSINSPGGSPVQSSLMASRIREYADKTKIPVYSFAEDYAASGGYWLLLAGDQDKIYAEKNSIVGSIGVITSTFGFTEAISKIGIERRILKSGENKIGIDPFLPIDDEAEKKMQNLLHGVHQNFKNFVKEKRGDKIKGISEDILFNADVFLGDDAQANGLIDGTGNMYSIIEKDFPKEKYIVKYKFFKPGKGFLSNFTGVNVDVNFPQLPFQTTFGGVVGSGSNNINMKI